MCCFDTFTEVKYKDAPNGQWMDSKYCSSCIQHLIDTQWETYTDNIKTEKCKVALKRLIDTGPPINLRDSLVFPCSNERNEVYEFLINGEIFSAKVKCPLSDEELTEYCNELRRFLV